MKMPQRKIYLFLPVSFFAFALYFLFPAPPAIGAHTYTLETWTVEEGLPQNSILCLLQDRTGYIWFGTQSGLVRFDGAAFRIYNRWNTPHNGHLRSDTVTALYQDDDNTLWVGTEGGGLSCMKNNEWRSYSTREGLPNDSIRAIYGDAEGNLWIGTANGLARLNKMNMTEETFQVYTDADEPWGDIITAVTGSSCGGLWIGTGNNGLYVVKNNKYQRFKPAGGPTIGEDAEITALCEDRSGCLWIGTEKGLLCLEKGRVHAPLPENHPLAGSAVRTLMPDSSGSLWIGTDGEGIYRLTAGVFTAVPLPQGLSDDFIYALCEDREANVWIGTYTNGLARLTPARVSAVTTENGLPQNLVRTVMEDRDGNLWVGTDRKGVVKITNDKVTDKILPGTRISTIYRDRAGNLWLGTPGSGVIRLENGNPALSFTYTTRDGLCSDEITVIRGDGDRAGVLWVGTTNGLNRFENGRFTSLTAFKNIHIKAIEESKTLWLGTAEGLLQLKGARWEAVLTGAGHKLGYDILCLYLDQQGEDLWFGTNGSGLGRLQLNNGAFTLYTTDAGLPHNYIFSILEDHEKNLWMSSYRGVFRVSRHQLDALAQKKISLLRPLYLDETDGMRSRECVRGGQPPAWKSAAGKLYFPTVKGLAVIDPASLGLNRIPPPVIIEEVLINNEPAAAGEKTVFPAGKNIIEFYFTALSFTAPGRVKLRYKLEGFDTRWVEVVPRQKRTALYLNLSPGSYRFNVIACNNDGLWNDKPAVFEFKIKAPFYRQPLFYLLTVLILAAAAAGGVWFSRKKRGGKQVKPKYKTSALLPETVEQVLPRLMQLMEQEKVFLNADLTLKSLAARLSVHYNYLSQIINEQMKQSFNDFINGYRIEEARKKLVDPAEKDKTVLDIAYETGFYSKSVFNTAFKKFTGMTPSQYRKTAAV